MSAPNGSALAGDTEPGGWRNLGGADRLLRIVAGAVMLAMPACDVVSDFAGITLGIFGWVPVATGLAGWSPFYAVLGITTRRPNPRRRAQE